MKDWIGKSIALSATAALVSVAVSVPVFVYLKNRNDSSIAIDTRRIADALCGGVRLDGAGLAD